MPVRPAPTPPPPARRAALAAGVVALAVLLGGCGLFDGGDRRDAALVGDSITDQSRATFQDELGDDWRLRIEAVPGLRIAEQQAALEAAVAEQPDAVVVNLGTNDVLGGHPVDAAARDLDVALATASAVPCPYVVTVNEHMFQLGRSDGWNESAIALNEELRRLADEHGIAVIDWSAEVGRQLEAGEPDGPVTTDTVHPTHPFGEALLAELYDEALADCAPA